MMDVQGVSWRSLRSEYLIGDLIECKVLRIEPFGMFVDVGMKIESGYMFCGVIDISAGGSGLKSLPVDRSLWPKVGDRLICKVISYNERNCQMYLAIVSDKVEN